MDINKHCHFPIKLFYCSCTVYMTFFINLTHLDQNIQKCTPQFVPRLIHFAVFSKLPAYQDPSPHLFETVE